jgi:hypothetical protein
MAMRLLNELTGKVVESTDEEWFDQEGFGLAIVNGVKVRFTIETDGSMDNDPFHFGYIAPEEAAKIPPAPVKMMKFFIASQYYGGDINLIEQAAKACDAQLVAVRGYALEDYPGNRSYVSGTALYIFFLERTALEEATEVVTTRIQQKVRELFLAQESCTEN